MDPVPVRVAAKPLKVDLPSELYLQLIRTKLLEGQTIATTVEEALRRYFAELERTDPALAARLRQPGEA